MSSTKALQRWHKAGLLSEEQVAQIEEYEREHASASWILYGITGLGVSVLLVGIISIIAANWFYLSDSVKLILYFFSLSAIAVATWKRLGIPGVVREALLTSFGLFVLAGIGLIGQTYHLESDGCSGLLLWLALLFPLLFLTESRLLNNIWFVGVVATVVLWNVESFRNDSAAQQIFTTLSLPYLFIALGYLVGSRSPEFSMAARVWGFATLLLPFAVGGNIAWSVGNHNFLEKSLTLGLWPILPIASALFAGVTAQARNFKRGGLITNAIYLVLGTSITLSIFPLTIPLGGEHPILGCGLFILAWSGAAAIAAGMDRRRLFDIAALVIGIRFIIVYFQVFGSLAATGFGLIVSGAVILGIAYCWYRFRSPIAKALREAV